MKQPRRVTPVQWLLIAAGVLFLLVFISPRGPASENVEISQVIQMAGAGQIEKIEVKGDELTVTATGGRVFESRKEAGASILEILEDRGVSTGPGGVQVDVKEEDGGGFAILASFLPIILIGGLLFYMMRRTQSGMGQVLNIGRSKAKQVIEKPSVSFSDVAGAEEAKQELVEVVEFLRDPSKFTKLGAKIPRGVLLVGPPGTGKTLISRAVAGEAEVGFFSTSGSEFVEMFVGVGWSGPDIPRQGASGAA